jgi:hypothetical protein
LLGASPILHISRIKVKPKWADGNLGWEVPFFPIYIIRQFFFATCHKNEPVHTNPQYNFNIRLTFTLSSTPASSNLCIYFRSPHQILYILSPLPCFLHAPSPHHSWFDQPNNFVINTDREYFLDTNPPVARCLSTLTPIYLTLYSEDPHYVRVYYSVRERERERERETHFHTHKKQCA